MSMWMKVLSYPTRWVVYIYMFTGLSYFITSTNRYMMYRPSDVFFLYYITGIVTVMGIPAISLLWLFGLFSLKTYLIISLILFVFPPILTISIMEYFVRTDKTNA